MLRNRARDVKNINSAVQRLIDDMIETMHDADGVGLAANQVGVPKRIIVVTAGEEEVLILLNPIFEALGDEEPGVEGCLSVPGEYGEVLRSCKIRVAALDRRGKKFAFEAEGLLARILQHEIDHLNGILFTDRAVRMLDPEELKSEDES